MALSAALPARRARFACVAPERAPTTRSYSPRYETSRTASCGRCCRSASCGEPEIDDVAVTHDVVLAFEPHLAAVTARGHRAAGDQVVVAHHLGADEAARDVAVNLARRELGGRAARNRPRAALVLAD